MTNQINADVIVDSPAPEAVSPEQAEAIRALCRRYNHSGVNPGAHFLAHKVLELLKEKSANG